MSAFIICSDTKSSLIGVQFRGEPWLFVAPIYLAKLLSELNKITLPAAKLLKFATASGPLKILARGPILRPCRLPPCLVLRRERLFLILLFCFPSEELGGSQARLC